VLIGEVIGPSAYLGGGLIMAACAVCTKDENSKISYLLSD
jgi:drug/metabolite transporter (DMT)-like permease